MRMLALLAIAACAPSSPSAPSFQVDVLPILAANCARCHGVPVIGGAPEGLRLDTYGDVAGENHVGAAPMHEEIAERVDDSNDRQMPPRFPLDDYQIEILQNWSQLSEGQGESPPRGAPRPNNAIPSVAVLDSVSDAARTVAVVEVTDADRDLVTGELRASVGGVERVIGLIRSGTQELVWNTASVPAGSYPLVAHVDDGAAVHVVRLGNLEVGAR